jgi:hypothetical protein
MLAEASLRGMSPMAVFCDWLDELHLEDPNRARALLASLPRETQLDYAEWRKTEP